MNKKIRLIFLGLSLLLLIGVGKFVTEDFNFLLNDFWFTSGFLLLILLSLIDQPHFSKDSNVFVNAVTAGVSLLLVSNDNRNWIFWVFFGVVIYLAISSYILMWLRNQPLLNENKMIQFVSRLNREIGKPQTIFSAFFLWGAINKFGVNSSGFNALLLYWVIFMILNLPSIATIINKLCGYALNPSEKYSEIGSRSNLISVLLILQDFTTCCTMRMNFLPIDFDLRRLNRKTYSSK